MISPGLFNLVRMLFIHGRDAYERATLDAPEYERRQNARTAEGCVGCFLVLMVLAFLLVAVLRS